MAYVIGGGFLAIGLALLLWAPDLSGALGQRIQNSPWSWRLAATALAVLGAVKLIQGHWNGLPMVIVGALVFARAPTAAARHVESSGPTLFLVGGSLATLLGMGLLLGVIQLAS